MRMWNINPTLMCRQHLLGEHNEMHMFDGCIRRMKSLRGYIDKGLVEIHNIPSRHEELATEMLKRGYKHNSSLESRYPFIDGKVDVEANMEELKRRCDECREMMNGKE